MRSLVASLAGVLSLSCAGATTPPPVPSPAPVSSGMVSSAKSGPRNATSMTPITPSPGTGAAGAGALGLNDAGESPSPAAEVTGTPGWLGVELAKRESGAGVLIRAVLRGSPAERAGVVAGDVVLSVDGQGVSRPIELRNAIAASGAGKRVSLGVLRGDATRLFAVDLEPSPSDDEMMRRSYVGARAPDFGALDAVQGSITPTLAALRGRVLVLEFWASWCGPCHVMAPTLQSWHDRYSAQGVTVLGVTSDPIDVAGRTAGEMGIAYPLARDSTGNMVRAYRAYALPTLFVIDKQGTVRDVLIGYSTPRLREIEALVKKLIAEG